VTERGILLLLMRGSGHDQQIRELIVEDGSMVVGEPFTGLNGILTGRPHAWAEPATPPAVNPPTASA